MKPVRTLFWFRRDLRLDDNVGLDRALEEAYDLGGCAVAIFLFDRDILNHLDPHDRRVPWIHESIVHLARSFADRGSRLLCLHGSILPELERLLPSFPDLVSIHCNHDQEPARLARDAGVDRFCQNKGLAFRSWKDATVLERDELQNLSGLPYRVYTPYRNAWRKRVESSPQLLDSAASLERSQDTLARIGNLPESSLPSLEQLGFKPCPPAFPTGETGALVQWKAFQPRLGAYPVDRDIPARDGTSGLATALRFGTISVRRLFRDSLTECVKWSDELIWREFHHMLLWNFPHTCTRSFQSVFDSLEWDDPSVAGTDAARRLLAWQEGMTGFPVVDAAMRELSRHGTMPNRLRMVVASFLTKDLHLHWMHGERWFARHLMDYDMAANVGNWQWAASTGADAQPWFRIFHPTTQGRKWDPDGTYVLRFCPELGQLPARSIHEPHVAPALLRATDYPAPIVDHARERLVALERFAKASGKSQN